MRPINRPTNNPPNEEIKNCVIDPVIVNTPVVRATIAILKLNIPAASFSKDSPSNIVISPRGSFLSCAIA